MGCLGLFLGLSMIGCHQQNLMDKRVDLNVPASAVAKVVAELAKASGIEMEAAQVLSKDIVLIDVHQKPVSEIMKRLADVIDGSWKNDKGIYRLTRTGQEERAQETRERKYRAGQISDEIGRSSAIRNSTLTAEQAKALRIQFEGLRAKNPRYSSDFYAELSGPLNGAPARKALLRTIAALNPSEVAMLDPGDRIVFSNKPTRVERQLPFSADEILSKFMAEQNVWADALSGLPEAGPNHISGDPLDAREPIAQTPDRILLTASRTNSSALVVFSMTILSADSTVGSSSLAIGNDAIRKFSRNLFDSPSTSGKKIELRSDSKTVLSAAKGFQQPNSSPVSGLTPEAIALLGKPESSDPLSFVATDGFVSVADAKHEDLIASLPDELVALSFFPNSASQTLEGFVQLANGIGDLVATEMDGWLSVKPARAYTTHKLRLDREALGRYLRGIITEGRSSLSSQAEFALNSQPSDYDFLGVPLGMLLDPNSTQNVDQDWLSLKIWGALSSDQRNELINGQKIQFKNLNPTQLELVEREAYHRPRKNFSGGVIRDVKDFSRWMEPAECLPDGLPPTGTLSVIAEGSKALLASSTQKNVQMTYARIFDEQQLGFTLANYEGANPDSNPMFDRFQLVKRATYKFVFQYTDEISDRTTLHDIVVPADSHPVSFGELPQDVRDKVVAAKVQAKNSPKNPVVRAVPPPR